MQPQLGRAPCNGQTRMVMGLVCREVISQCMYGYDKLFQIAVLRGSHLGG